MCVFKLFVLIVFRVGTTNTPSMKMTVVVVLIITIGLGQLHDGLGVGVHGGQRDADRVEPEGPEERQARSLEIGMVGVARADECYDDDAEAVGREPVPPLPSRFILTAHPRPHAGFSFAHDCCVSQSRLLRVLPLIPHSRCCNNTLLQTEHVECLLVCAETCGRGRVQVRALQ